MSAAQSGAAAARRVVLAVEMLETSLKRIRRIGEPMEF